MTQQEHQQQEEEEEEQEEEEGENVLSITYGFAVGKNMLPKKEGEIGGISST